MIDVSFFILISIRILPSSGPFFSSHQMFQLMDDVADWADEFGRRDDVAVHFLLLVRDK